MKRSREIKRREKGFTLAELLIVVAIIAVLVAISIPIFNSQLEKARRAVDMHTARNIESVLVAAVNDGTVQINQVSNGNEVGVWVMLCRDRNSWPDAYTDSSKVHDTVFCGSEKNISINGTMTTADWNSYNKDVENILTQAGIDVNSLKIKSKGGADSWDWIIIEAGYLNNQVFARMYSGFKGGKSSAKEPVNAPGQTNIDKMIG